jgi:hypothetical protein
MVIAHRIVLQMRTPFFQFRKNLVKPNESTSENTRCHRVCIVCRLSSGDAPGRFCECAGKSEFNCGDRTGRTFSRDSSIRNASPRGSSCCQCGSSQNSKHGNPERFSACGLSSKGTLVAFLRAWNRLAISCYICSHEYGNAGRSWHAQLHF